MLNTFLQSYFSYATHQQLDVLEEIMILRPYNLDASPKLIIGLLEAMVEDSFTLADLVKFADDAETYVLQKWGREGQALIADKNSWPGALSFHKQLGALWIKLEKSIQARLESGETLSRLIEDLESDLERFNREICTHAAVFKFP